MERSTEIADQLALSGESESESRAHTPRTPGGMTSNQQRNDGTPNEHTKLLLPPSNATINPLLLHIWESIKSVLTPRMIKKPEIAATPVAPSTMAEHVQKSPVVPSTMAEQLQTYQDSDLRRFAKDIATKTPSERLMILEAPTSVVRWSFSLILEHMLEVVGSENYNSPYDILEKANKGLKFIIENMRRNKPYAPLFEVENLMRKYTVFMAIDGILRYYEDKKVPAQGDRKTCVDHVLSNQITSKLEATPCEICLEDLDEPMDDQQRKRLHRKFKVAPIFPGQSGVTGENPSNNIRGAGAKYLVTWLPDFIDVVLGEEDPETPFPPFDRPWEHFMKMNRLPSAVDHDDPKTAMCIEGINNFSQTLRSMGITLVLYKLQIDMRKPSPPLEEVIIKLHGKHMFHRNCAHRWLMEYGTCPTCRKFLIEWDDGEKKSAHVVDTTEEERIREKFFKGQTRPLFAPVVDPFARATNFLWFGDVL